MNRLELLKILKKISDGELDIDNVPLDKLYSEYKRYVSPEDRNSYNYGYMTLPEVTVN